MPKADTIPTIDTIAAAHHKPMKLAMHPDTTWCREIDAPSSAAEIAICHIGRPAYTQGIPPTPRPELPGYNSGIMALLIGIFLIITINFSHYTTFIKTFTQNLFSVRRRANVFDEHSTTNETRILISFILLLCISEGILIFTAAESKGFDLPNFPAVGLFSTLALLYYAIQLAVYSTVGYVFTTPKRAIIWMKGFNASQTLLAITISIPAIISLFYPEAATLLLSAAAVCYFISRSIFIFKGFRIFYNNSLALLYFILYLCSLEIIPLIIIYKASLYCCSIL